MSIEKPTIEEQHKLLNSALIEDLDSMDNSNLIKDKISLEGQTLIFIKNILIEKYDHVIANSLINEVEYDIPYLLNEIELVENNLEVFAPLDRLLEKCYIKGDKLKVERNFKYIDDLKDTLITLPYSDRIKLLTELRINNDDRISRDNEEFGKSSKTDNFFKDQFALLIEREHLNYQECESHHEHSTESNSVHETNDFDHNQVDWALIFHFTFDRDLLPKTKYKKDALETFHITYKIFYSLNSLYNMLYEVNTRLIDYDFLIIKNLKKIKPFIEINFPVLISVIDDEITMIEAGQK